MTNNIHYIKKISISDFWQKYNIIWELNPDVNILAGINGSGKTTILDCVCGLVAVGKIPKPYLGMLARLELFFDNGKSLPYRYMKVKDTLSNLKKKAKTSALYKEIVSEIKEKAGDDYNNIASVEFERHSTSFEDLHMSLLELRKSIHISVISTFDTPLQAAEAVSKLSDKVKTGLDFELYQLQQQYLNYQLDLSKRKDIVVNEMAGDQVKISVEKLMYPQVRFLEIVDDLFSETGKKINRKKNYVEFLLGKQEIELFQLSSGEKQLLVILLTVLVQDNKPSILFMDEPEISLHIAWQRKIIKYIRELNPNAQVIIATHSPAIIMEGWHDKVFEVRDIMKCNKS